MLSRDLVHKYLSQAYHDTNRQLETKANNSKIIIGPAPRGQPAFMPNLQQGGHQ